MQEKDRFTKATLLEHVKGLGFKSLKEWQTRDRNSYQYAYVRKWQRDISKALDWKLRRK
jgi:hypothetical protein